MPALEKPYPRDPENRGFPNKWRVDGQLGLGPAYTRDGDWELDKGQSETIRHRLIVYTGELNEVAINEAWNEFADRDGLYSMVELWSLAQAEGRNAKFLSPQEAVDAMTVKEGYEVNCGRNRWMRIACNCSQNLALTAISQCMQHRDRTDVVIIRAHVGIEDDVGDVFTLRLFFPAV